MGLSWQDGPGRESDEQIVAGLVDEFAARRRMWEGQGLDRNSASAPGHSDDLAGRASGLAMMAQYQEAARALADARAAIEAAAQKLGSYSEEAKALGRTLAEIERVEAIARARGGRS